jgi:predicted Zn-dependent protease
MPSFFEELGRGAGRLLRKASWFGQELLGTEEQALEAEYRVGHDLAAALAADLPDGQRPFREARVEACGQRLVACLKKRRRRFQFQVLPGRELNAFTLPGGFIYITQPLLALCLTHGNAQSRAGDNRSEVEPEQAELAFVLGHEMGHVIRAHVKDRIMGNSLLSLVLSAAPGGGALQQALRQLARQLVKSDYSQEQELEADKDGLKLLRLAGWDPTASIQVLELLQSQQPRETALDTYLSSHPPFAVRLANMQRLLRA